MNSLMYVSPEITSPRSITWKYSHESPDQNRWTPGNPRNPPEVAPRHAGP